MSVKYDLEGSLVLMDHCERVMNDALELIRRSEDLMARSETLVQESVSLGRDIVSTFRTFVDARMHD